MVYWISAALVPAGCAHLNDPFKDSSAVIDPEISTVSATAYQGKAEIHTGARRTWTPATVWFENGAVTHWALVFEDPFEDKGNRLESVEDIDAPDNRFAWNWVDYSHMGYGPGRWVLNTLAVPITLFATPPGMVLESDGRIDRGWAGWEHDATASDPDTREPPDMSRINKPAPESLGEAVDQTADEEVLDEEAGSGVAGGPAPVSPAPAPPGMLR